MRDGASSGGLGRWALPGALVWAQWMLSAFAYQRRLPRAVIEDPSVLLRVLLLGLPIASGLVLLGLRRLDRAPASRSPQGDAVVTWLLAALFAAHALILAVVTGALPSLHPGLALIAGILMLGLAAALPTLPVGCPFGLVTASTRHDPRAWRQVHRELAIGCALSGGLALGSALAPVALASALALIPAGIALVRGLLRRSSSLEHTDGDERPRPPTVDPSP